MHCLKDERKRFASVCLIRPSNCGRERQQKKSFAPMREYIAQGARLGWRIDPSGTVEIYRPGRRSRSSISPRHSLRDVLPDSCSTERNLCSIEASDVNKFRTSTQTANDSSDPRGGNGPWSRYAALMRPSSGALPVLPADHRPALSEGWPVSCSSRRRRWGPSTTALTAHDLSQPGLGLVIIAITMIPRDGLVQLDVPVRILPPSLRLIGNRRNTSR